MPAEDKREREMIYLKKLARASCPDITYSTGGQNSQMAESQRTKKENKSDHVGLLCKHWDCFIQRVHLHAQEILIDRPAGARLNGRAIRVCVLRQNGCCVGCF